LRLEEALARLEAEFPANPDIRLLLDFIRGSKRGIGSGRRGIREE
jgi:UDP-N-acetylglucosamine acyltransferase